jgi:hypothetical protein
MNEATFHSPLGPAGGRAFFWRIVHAARRHSSALLAGLLLVTGCQRREEDHVQLSFRYLPHESVTRLEIQAQVAGSLAGLRYKWFTVLGECEPQESAQPKTIFTFPEGVRQDRVSVEVWRGDQRLAQGELHVKYDEERDRLQSAKLSEVIIEITKVPPAETGGPQSHANIAGRVLGAIPPFSRVLVYVRAFGAWHLQPMAQATHPLHQDNTWATWTHTGNRYAALLVRQDYEPINKLDMLPEPNQRILARTLVDGTPKVAKDAATPAAVPGAKP